MDSRAADAEEFMAVAAHDLRNPVAVMRASAQMAQRQISRGDATAAQARLKAIVEQTDRLTEMLETFLDAARIGAERMSLRTERVGVREVVEIAAERASGMLGETAAERVVQIDVPDGLSGTWDRARVGRAVRALLMNAMQYGDQRQPVHVLARRNGAAVSIVITGGGAGPDQDEVLHLFERFYRGRSAAEAGQSGSGLGLFCARGIARMHGGDVRRIEGDRFELELPLAD